MSRTRKTRKTKGTADKQMLAELGLPVAGHDAAPPAERTADEMITTSKAPESQGPVGLPPETVPSEASHADITVAAAPPAVAPASLGERLRTGREVRGWTTEDVGRRLHLPVQIIQRLEAEQYERIGYGIYLRGYLLNYARLVDVPTILVDAVVRQREDTPPLIASGTISHSRYLYQRYSVSALYLILTGVIIVPAVLLAMRAGLQPNVSELTPLEAPTASVEAGQPAPADKAPVASAPGAAADGSAASGDAPLVASLAPFSALTHNNPPHGDTPPAPAATAGAHVLKLSLREPSWVEIQSTSGEKLEYGLLPAGTSRTYSSDKPLEVRLGNCAGAEVETDGRLQDLTPYRHANVARFKLFVAGEAISRTD